MQALAAAYAWSCRRTRRCGLAVASCSCSSRAPLRLRRRCVELLPLQLRMARRTPRPQHVRIRRTARSLHARRTHFGRPPRSPVLEAATLAALAGCCTPRSRRPRPPLMLGAAPLDPEGRRTVVPVGRCARRSWRPPCPEVRRARHRCLELPLFLPLTPPPAPAGRRRPVLGCGRERSGGEREVVDGKR